MSNPFQDLIGTGSAQNQGQQGGGYQQLFNEYRSKPVQTKKKKKDFWTDQISTGGGIGGSLGGAAAGAAIGSIVPGIGTAIGGLVGGIAGGALGSGAGEYTENVITNEKDKFKNVGQEAVLGGIFSAPPIRLGKGLIGVAKGGGKAALETALTKTATKGGSKLIQNMGAKTYAQAFNIPRKFTGKLKPEQTAKDLMRYGVGGGLDKIEATSSKALSTLGGILDKSVTGIGGDVKVDSISGVFKNLEKFNIPKGEIQALRRSVTDIGTTGRNLGYENPTRMLDSIRELEKRGYDLIKAGESNLSKNPNTSALGGAYLEAARGLEDNLYSAITSKGTIKALQTEGNKKVLNSIAKGLGDEFMGIKDPKELRTLMSPFVRSRQLVNLTKDEAQAAGTQGMSNIAGRGVGGGTGAVVGSMVGGPIGAAVGAGTGFLAAPVLRGAQEAVQAPISTAVGRGLTKLGGGARAGAGQTLSPVKAATGGLGALTARQAIGQNVFNPNQQQPQPSLEDSLLQQSQGQGLTDSSVQQTGMETQPVEQSPYTRENLIYDMQRDPKNAENYMSYYTSMQEIYAQPQQQDLSQSSKNAMVSSDNAINTIDQLEGLFSSAGNGSGRIGGFVQGINADLGLDENAKVYNSLSKASVTQIAKALAGSGSGTVSDMDAKVIIAALPTLRDTPAEAKAKFAALKQRLENARNNTMYYGGSSGGSTLEDILMQQQGAN